MNTQYKKKAYNTLFIVLEELYEKTKNNSLGALLGSMDPNLFLESNSADPAAYEDFCECLNECLNNSLVANVKTAYHASVQFLNFYKNEFGYNFDYAEKFIDYEKYKELFNKS